MKRTRKPYADLPRGALIASCGANLERAKVYFKGIFYWSDIELDEVVENYYKVSNTTKSETNFIVVREKGRSRLEDITLPHGYFTSRS
jgi:hypothetical protein